MNAIVGLALIGAAATAALTLALEIEVRDSRALLGGGASMLWLVDEDAQPRALLANALLLARRAAPMPQGATRSDLLQRAAGRAAKASQARAHWGDAWLVRAYIAALARPDGPEAVKALARSYVDAPFLRNGAEWRVEYGIARWAALDEQSRKRLVDEAIVFAQLNPDSMRRMFDLVRGSGAYRPFVVAWRGVLRERQLNGND